MSPLFGSKSKVLEIVEELMFSRPIFFAPSTWHSREGMPTNSCELSSKMCSIFFASAFRAPRKLDKKHRQSKIIYKITGITSEEVRKWEERIDEGAKQEFNHNIANDSSPSFTTSCLPSMKSSGRELDVFLG
jgi:hypothetical protein